MAYRLQEDVRSVFTLKLWLRENPSKLTNKCQLSISEESRKQVKRIQQDSLERFLLELATVVGVQHMAMRHVLLKNLKTFSLRCLIGPQLNGTDKEN